MFTRPVGANPLTRALSRLYGAAVAARNRAYDRDPRRVRRASRPVVSVGGVHAGGTGKTPLCLYVARLLHSRGCTAAFLSRGYRRRSKDTVILAPGEASTWEIVGDEPLMLHENLAGSWLGVGADRYASAALMSSRLPPRSVFVLDDGFQHRGLHRDLDIVCVPPGPYTDELLPAGSLREPLENIRRAHAVCVVGADDRAARESVAAIAALAGDAPVFALVQKPGVWVRLSDGAKAIRPPCAGPAVVTGIARPERFLGTVRGMGITPAAEYVFADHHPFSGRDFRRIAAGGYGAVLTTEKDSARIRSLFLACGLEIWYLRTNLESVETGEGGRLAEFILEKIANGGIAGLIEKQEGVVP